MFGSILEIFEKPKAQPLLYVFLSISLLTYFEETNILTKPFSWRLVYLPISVFISYFLVYEWKSLIWKINCKLSENDITNWSPIIGCSILTFCIIVTLSSIANNPEILKFKLLAEPSFIRLSTLYLLAIETIKIPRG